MRRIWIVGLALMATLAACSSGGSTSSAAKATQRQADLYGIDQIEVTWHKASSTKDVNLMMSLWADNATLTIATAFLSGKDQIRTFFETKAAPFRPEHHWVSETPAYKTRATVDGEFGTLYFECHYTDIATRQVVNVVAADMNVARVKGRWLITKSVASSTTLSA